MKGIVIAGTHSGCGKTTLTLGIMAALRKKGLAVQPFKAGPDFIDAGLHRLAAGRVSRNLDLWMCGSEFVATTFARHAAAADIAVVEGVMGLYDGEFNTARLASHLGLPVVLVVDAYGMAESAGAIVTGFSKFKVQSSKFKDQDNNSALSIQHSALNFAGVIFNRVASESHYQRLKDSVQDMPVLGYLPREAKFEIPHRHLGLTTAEEEPISRENIEKLADDVLAHIDVDAILRSAQTDATRTTGDIDRFALRIPHSALRIAVARDKAFCFYYEDNLDMLRDAGAEIVHFSPLADTVLPAADLVYIGGGYPELHAEALSKNEPMRSQVRAWVEAGKPLYAECGGLMYLSRSILRDGTTYPMAGVFPFGTRMLGKPRLGYREVVLSEECLLGAKGGIARGHEFHYSEIDEVRSAECGVRSEQQIKTVYDVRDSRGQGRGMEGYRYKNTLASYIHLHFGYDPAIATRMISIVRGEVKA